MSTDPQNNTGDQEVDLSQISRRIGNAFENLGTAIFNAIQFFIRHIIVISILFISGIVLGYYMDTTNKSYDHQIIVMPNFGSADYLYAKIDLLEAKIRERDTIFLESIGFPAPSRLAKIEIKPIVDLYPFINSNERQNLELLKLMSEDGDINKIVEDNTTSKNYTSHRITFKTKKILRNRKTVDALLLYLNNNGYYQNVQKEYSKNVLVKLKANDITIVQINGFLDKLSSAQNQDGKSANLVYYNENTQLNDVIKTKEQLVAEQGRLRLNLINTEKIIKETSVIVNIENKESINGKRKLIVPIVFVGLYILLYILFRFYKRQASKAKL